jgi:acetoin utilization deacetylase AcuC-like enzyme
MIFVAAGQDSHRDDPVSGLELTDDGYAAMTSKIMELADEVCNGRLVVSLEGGYNVKTLPQTHQSIVLSLLGVNPPEITGDVKGSTKKILWDLRGKLRSTPMDG